jgi:hypothetical protein
MKKFPIWILLLLISWGHTDEISDIEALPSLRTQRYPMEPYKKIVVFSAPRTGSSLMYNICRFLFEKETHFSHRHDDFDQSSSVLKTHKYADADALKEGEILYIVPIRNPLDACASTYRIRPFPEQQEQSYCKALVSRQLNHLIFMEKKKEAGAQVAFIKYEDFADNLDYLFSFIEANCSIRISDIDKAIMKNGYSRENVYSSTHSLPDFGQYLPLSGFHGQHVTLEAYTTPDVVLYWLNYYLEGVKPAYRKHGYFTD